MNLKEICLALSREIHKLVPYDRAAIALPQGKNYVSVYAEESRLTASAIPEGVSVAKGTATGWVLKHREPMTCRDVRKDDRFPLTHKRYKAVGIRSYVILPLIAKGEVLGALSLGSLKAGRFGKKEIEVLSPIAEILSLAIENSRLYEESQKREEMQKLLKELGQDITFLDIDSLLQKLTKKVCEVLKVDVSDVRLMVNGAWRSLGVSGIEPGRLQSAVTGSGLKRSRLVIESRKPLVVEDMIKETAARQGSRAVHLGFRGYAGIPVFSRGGEVIGVLRVLTFQPRHFTHDEVDLLQQLANGGAIAIQNARLFEEVQKKSQELERANAERENIMETIPDIIYVLDLNGNLIRWNRKVEIVTGWSPEELRNRHALEFFPEEDKPAIAEAIRRAYETGQTEAEGRILRRDGSTVPYYWTGGTLKDGEGNVIGITGTGRDITAAKHAETEIQKLLEEVRKNSEGLEVLVKINRDVASLLKRDVLLPRIANEARKFLAVDGASFRLLEGELLVRAGYAGEEDLSALNPAIPLGESITGKIVQENRVIAIRNVLADSMIIEEHRRILSRAGYRSFLGVPLRLGRSVIGTINLYSKQEREFRPDEIRLITAFADQAAIALENARLFEEVQKKSAELEDAFRIKSDFFNTMAHELRTPLNVVIGTQQLLIDGSYGGLTGEQSKALERIGRYAEDLLDLINEILDLMRLEARKVPVHCEEFSVRDVTDDLAVSFDPLAREKGLELSFDIGAGIPRLNSDRSKIREILQNLVANAVKYTERGKVELRVSLRQLDGSARNGRVSWSVRDTGIGIDESDLPHLFEPFYMADGVDRRKYPGSGLGLSIVKRLVELLGGTIKIESERWKGSTFTVTLPVSHADG